MGHGPGSAPLILASASPRRRELLTAAGVAFEVVPSSVPETQRPGEPGAAFAQRIALEKARAVARQRPGRCILAADTVVIADDVVFGKPADRNEARRMLQTLSGRSHRVLTAVAVIEPGGSAAAAAVDTTVEFRPLAAEEIEAYLETGEPFDKAGAYAIQGGAQLFVTRVHGSYSNVVGLPVDEVLDLLRRHCPGAVATVPTP